MVQYFTTDKPITPSQKSMKIGSEKWNHFSNDGKPSLWYEYKHIDKRVFCISVPDVGVNSIEFARYLRDEYFGIKCKN